MRRRRATVHRHHHFHLDRDDEHCALSVVGELDLASTTEFRAAVCEMMGSGQRDVSVDLAHTDFLDSSGIGILLWAHHRLEAAGGHLRVLNAHGDVDRVLRITGTDRVLLDAAPTG
jgi:anti-sigma B factor antagonist